MNIFVNHKANSIKTITIILFLSMGSLLILLFGFRLWTYIVVITSLAALIPFMILVDQYPDVAIFLGILLNFTPLKQNVGFYLILFVAVVHFTKKLLMNKPIFKNDIIIYIWCIFIGLSLISMYKWVSIYRGLRGTVNFILIPMVLYILINHDYLDIHSIKRFFKYYFPLLHTYILIQIILLVISGTAVTGYSLIEFHTGFRLAWGGTVFLSALLLFLSILIVQTKQFWKKSRAINILVFFNISLSVVFITLIMARASIVSLFAALLVFLLFKNIVLKNKLTFKYSYIIAFLVAGTIVYFSFSNFINYLVYRFIHMKHDLSFLLRLYIYAQGFLAFKHNIIVGAGPDQVFYKDYISQVTDPNNIFISYAVSYGFIGLTLLTALFFYPFRVLFKMVKTGKDKSGNHLGMLLIPVLTLAIINSCVEVVITSFCYGSIFWTVYALFYRVYDLETTEN